MRILLSGVAIEGGGAERVIQDLARGFVARGQEVCIAFLEGTDNVVPELEALGIHCVRLLQRQQWTKSALADFTPSCIARFRRLLREYQPHILHSHVPRPTLWAALAWRTLRRRPLFVYTEHSIQDLYPFWMRDLYRLIFPVLAGVICVSEAVRKSFEQRWRLRIPVQRIWNGIPAQAVFVPEAAAALRSSLGVPEEAPLIGTVGNVRYCKGHDLLVAAMARVRQSFPAARCVIAGSLTLEPATAAAVEQAIHAQQLEQTVQLLGFRHDIPALLSAFDLFVLSSRQEGFPITILEAMAAGKPVVATDVGGCREAVVEGETGLIVLPEDPEALAKAICTLLSDPERARRMGEAGRQRVQQEFTRERMVEAHLAFYEQLLKRAPAHA